MSERFARQASPPTVDSAGTTSPGIASNARPRADRVERLAIMRQTARVSAPTAR